MEEVTPSETSEELRGEENITETEGSVSPEETAESVSPEPIVEPIVDDYPQCSLSDEDVERIAKAISKNIVVTLRGE